MLLKTTAVRPRCRISSGEAAEVLDDGAARGQIALQDGDATLVLEWLRQRRDHLD